MSQAITIWGASYTQVPAITLPKTGGGTARFTDTSGTTASASDVANGKKFVNAAGTEETGSLAFVTYYTSTSNPTSSQGSNGDIWLVTT